MDATEEFEKFSRKLLGWRVSDWCLAANSLSIYLGGKPADDCTVRFWLEPTWHVVGPRGVLLGSRQAQVEGKEAHSRVAQPLEQLDGKSLRGISVEELTFDLHLTFDDGYSIRTFASDPTDDESWYVKDNASKIYIVASPSGLRIETGEERREPANDPSDPAPV